MKLSELFLGNKQITDTGNVQSQSVRESGNFNRQMQSLSPGQIIQGEVISRNGNEVQIKVADDCVLKAKVDRNIHLELGKTITFEVKNNGQTLTLSPLYTNTAMDANVLKALDMASLPITSDTIYMTEQMMQAGLSIDRTSLQQMYKEVTMFSGTSISDIVDLHRMTIPVNEENLAQLSSYKNMTHQLVNGLNEVANGVSDAVYQMLQYGETEGAAKLYQEIIQLISETGGKPANGTADGSLLQEDNLQTELFGVNGSANGLAGEAQLGGEFRLLLDMLAVRNNAAVQLDGGTVDGGTVDGGIVDGSTVGGVSVDGNSAPGVLRAENDALGVQQSDINTLLGKLLQQGIHTKDNTLLQDLLQNKEIAAYIKENLKEMWTIMPRDVAEGERVSELYRRLGKQLSGLARTLEAVNQTGSEAYHAITNLTRNLDFLQQMNQTYTYLQLPLRLQQGNDAHGDLYVYTGKKHLASKEGQITALLHLDMENLGPLDVYVAMQGEKVSTKFYVQDEILDFLAEHMHILTERLHKRGYHCSCEMVTRKEEAAAKESVIHKLLEKEPQIPLVQYAFDVRT